MSIRSVSLIGCSVTTGSGRRRRTPRPADACSASRRRRPPGPASARNGSVGKPGQQRQHRRGAGGHRQRLRAAAELADQRGIGGALHAALGHHDAGGGGDQQRGDLRHQAVAGGQRGEGGGGVGERHAVPQQADRQAADDVDHGDDQRRDRVAADELRGAVHGAVEAAFLLQFAAAAARLLLVDQAGGEVGVDRHLLARHRVQAEPRGDLGDAAGALGDDHEVHHQQDREHDQPDHHVAAHQEAAERRHHVAGGERAFVAVRQDQPGDRDVERQAQQRGQQQQCGEAGEVERPVEEQRHHQDQHRGGDGEREAEVEQQGRQRQDQHGEQRDHAERKTDVAAGGELAETRGQAGRDQAGDGISHAVAPPPPTPPQGEGE